MTNPSDNSSEPPRRPHPLEAALAALVGTLLITLTAGVFYILAERWSPPTFSLPDRFTEITAGSIAGFVGVLAFFFGLSGALQRRISLAVGSPARGQPGGLAGMGAVAGGLGAALGGALLVATAGRLILPDLALPIYPLASGLAGAAALLLAWMVAEGLHILGY